mmetsp:Transcript_64755/g.76020  ORF Transcript_64755/g.76020 Transcript_64755/m.76020 type:complete len:82 (-) Transcript_64755:706-951(-)
MASQDSTSEQPQQAGAGFTSSYHSGNYHRNTGNTTMWSGGMSGRRGDGFRGSERGEPVTHVNFFDNFADDFDLSDVFPSKK